MRKNGLLSLTVMLFCCTAAAAQDDGYLMEVGVGGGSSFYLGDANSRMYDNTNGAFAIVARYNVNPRFALKANLATAGISGSTEYSYGALPGGQLSFSRTLYELGMQMEWGFCGYGMTGWSGQHRLAPYGLMGIGITYAPKPVSNDLTASFPLGLGVRYKLSERVNIGLEWTMRFSASDRLDVTQNTDPSFENPFMIKGKGIKNRDSYSFTLLYVTFDILERPCNCN